MRPQMIWFFEHGSLRWKPLVWRMLWSNSPTEKVAAGRCRSSDRQRGNWFSQENEVLALCSLPRWQAQSRKACWGLKRFNVISVSLERCGVSLLRKHKTWNFGRKIEKQAATNRYRCSGRKKWANTCNFLIGNKRVSKSGVNSFTNDQHSSGWVEFAQTESWFLTKSAGRCRRGSSEHPNAGCRFLRELAELEQTLRPGRKIMRGSRKVATTIFRRDSRKLLL
jgi:hypothetical protein